MNRLPHRFPFLLVDRVVEYVPGKYAIGIKNVTVNDNFFPGHFPTRPLMPGVLQVEAMAQVRAKGSAYCAVAHRAGLPTPRCARPDGAVRKGELGSFMAVADRA